MAWTQTDLDALDAKIDDVRKVTFPDGRSVEKHDLDKLLELRERMKGEVAASNARANPPVRSTVGRIFR